MRCCVIHHGKVVDKLRLLDGDVLENSVTVTVGKDVDLYVERVDGAYLIEDGTIAANSGESR